uniref:ASA1 n=1 Tax=Arundo donax TaxID=35708 RepID=A0A0A9DRY7_ARUDO
MYHKLEQLPSVSYNTSIHCRLFIHD